MMAGSRKRSVSRDASEVKSRKNAKEKSPGPASTTVKRPRRSPSSEAKPRNGSRSASGSRRDGKKVPNAVVSSSALLTVGLTAALSVFLVYSLFSLAPRVDSAECERVGGAAWFVRGAVQDAKRTALTLSECASKYDSTHPEWTLVLYISVYLLLQAFAIPGPIILSLVSGVLWPLWKAQAVIAFCATTGASLCYVMSRTLGVGDVIAGLNPARAEQFRARVREADKAGNLLYFMLFLRISPLLPNWFVNLASPGAGVPLRTFALATALGLIPANILHYHTGKQLHELVVHAQEGNTVRNFAILLSLQFLALLPTLFKSTFKEKLNVG